MADCFEFFIRISAVQPMKNIPATIRVAAELKEKGRQQITDMALRDDFEVKIVVGEQG